MRDRGRIPGAASGPSVRSRAADLIEMRPEVYDEITEELLECHEFAEIRVPRVGRHIPRAARIDSAEGCTVPPTTSLRTSRTGAPAVPDVGAPAS